MATVLRFMVCSDLHFSDNPESLNRRRFEKGLRDLFSYAAAQAYSAVDAIIIVGDFATRGTRIQMELVKESLDRLVPSETTVRLCLSSHEYWRPDGEAAARADFTEVFGQAADTHEVIGGHHFIMLSSTDGTRFRAPQKDYAARELAAAHRDTPKKPIFFFQHPHLSDTVYGSIRWGEVDLVPILMNYPQIIDFSGHSHAPINDPRSIHQYHFTSIGTGSIIGDDGGIEMDDFDKEEGTYPADCRQGACFHIVEVSENETVTVRPYDILTGRFFDVCWTVPTAWDPESFVYTRDRRFREAKPPFFPEGASLSLTQDADGVLVTFPQAAGVSEDRVLDYIITFYRGDVAERRVALWSGYYLNDMPRTLTKRVSGLAPGIYTVTVRARGFFENLSESVLTGDIEIK